MHSFRQSLRRAARRLFRPFAGLLGLLLALGLIEVGLRLLLGPELGDRRIEPDPLSLWVPDPELGWDNLPSSEGRYRDGSFEGSFHFDEEGLRLNDSTSTLLPEASDILFLGDSTTVSLEIDDAETIPARIERALRRRGERVNVRNLGVRGYGTDQSVDKAIRFSRGRSATEAFYLFVPNDIYETQVGKTWGLPYSKPLYWMEPGSARPQRLPPRKAALEEGRLVVLDPDCRPFLHQGSTLERPPHEADRLQSFPFIYRAYVHFYLSPERSRAAGQIEPYQRIQNGESWSHGFIPAYLDDGSVRMRCPEYFESQMRFHLERLRVETGVTRLTVVHFPHERAQRMQREGGSPNVAMFEALLEAGVIDAYIDLNREATDRGTSLRSLRCRSDPHFCTRGNEWIAERILERIEGTRIRENPDDGPTSSEREYSSAP